MWGAVGTISAHIDKVLDAIRYSHTRAWKVLCAHGATTAQRKSFAHTGVELPRRNDLSVKLAVAEFAKNKVISRCPGASWAN